LADSLLNLKPETLQPETLAYSCGHAERGATINASINTILDEREGRGLASGRLQARPLEQAR
jgi:hypothetical protein